MAWTQNDLDAVETAIKAGAKRVRIGDKEVEYDLETLKRLRDEMRADLGHAKPLRAIKMRYSKGL